MKQTEAIRLALRSEVRHRRRSRELAAEVAALEADEQEMPAVAELMDALHASR